MVPTLRSPSQEDGWSEGLQGKTEGFSLNRDLQSLPYSALCTQAAKPIPFSGGLEDASLEKLGSF